MEEENKKLKKEKEDQDILISSFFSILDDINVSEGMSNEKAEYGVKMILGKVIH